MTTDHPSPHPYRTQVDGLNASPSPSASALSQPDKAGTAGLVTAGAISALLSGDVRLAVRATRLLMDDSEPASPPSPAGAPRPRRVWRRPSRR
jgi:hypothetical protein